MVCVMPNPRRSILLHGLRLVLFVPGALLWTYAFNLGVAVLFSMRLNAQLASILDHSLAAERLNSAFDLGTFSELIQRLSLNAPSTGATAYIGLPVYLLGYFILVPGTLFCYRSEAPSRLPILVSSGIAYFWRFIRITLLTGLVSLVVLGPLLAAQAAWSAHVDETTVGMDAVIAKLPGLVLILLVAALLRLYFDLVEAYTVQLGDHYRENGKQDRRVRRTLRPAMRTLRLNFLRAYGSFVLLTLLGFAAVFFSGQGVAHMLAQPRVWPAFLVAQLGLIGMMATRFWQRGAETILASDYPLPRPVLPADVEMADEPFEPVPYPNDAQSDPEPAAPSLDQPDPAIVPYDRSTSRSYRAVGGDGR
jgi:hypothetical protein